MGDERDHRTDDAGRVGRCPCCDVALCPTEDEVRIGRWHVAGQGPGSVILAVCPHCRERLIGENKGCAEWGAIDPTGIVWHPGRHWDAKLWGL